MCMCVYVRACMCFNLRETGVYVCACVYVRACVFKQCRVSTNVCTALRASDKKGGGNATGKHVCERVCACLRVCVCVCYGYVACSKKVGYR